MAPIETRTIQTHTILRCDKPHGMSFPGVVGDSPVTVKAKARAAGWHVATIYPHENGHLDASRPVEKVLCPRHARERAMCGHEPRHLVWKAQDGEVVICKMDDSHLVNALKFLVDNWRTDEDAYRQMYNEKQQRGKDLDARLGTFHEGAPAAIRLSVLRSYEPPVPPYRPAVLKHVEPIPAITMQRYDLVKELPAGEHVVVSRKADKGMVLNIDEDTVRALYTVLRHVSGFPDSPRRFTQAVLDGITAAIPQSEWAAPWVVYPSDDAVEGVLKFLNGKQLAEKRKTQQIRAAARTTPIFGPGAAPADDGVEFPVDGRWLN